MSKEFSTEARGDSKHYKITTAFTNYVFDTIEQADAIIYPSTVNKLKGFNFVLPPYIADQKLQFIAANRRKMSRISTTNYVETEFIESVSVEGDIIVWPLNNI
ncbi:hypothetical protein [Flavobacterium cyanobacteriorum]|uniref:hypothetical protein n=1 Tax=Flavobacterium cyanobacteriorum TaxID=2022802 RepID=UPI00101AEC7E|nr:hypothetical protein [Flavobacterium cyanobacteriorum]